MSSSPSPTHNGVRAHLAILERDGIVRQRGSVRRGSGGGKPAYIYELTQEAEELFAKAYAPALGRLLDVLSEQLGSEESEALVRLVGRRLAGEHSTRVDGAHARLESAVEVFNELGGLAELEEHDGTHIIRGYACPLAAVTPDHPEVCRLAEALVAEVAGTPVHEGLAAGGPRRQGHLHGQQPRRETRRVHDRAAGRALIWGYFDRDTINGGAGIDRRTRRSELYCAERCRQRSAGQR